MKANSRAFAGGRCQGVQSMSMVVIARTGG